MDINPILLDLEIIKQINENEKLAINILPGSVKLFVDNNQYLTGIKRWYKGYNREDSIKYLEDLTNNIEKTSEIILNGNHNNLGEILKKAIIQSITGINNLKNTYIHDSIITAKLILITNRLYKVVSNLTEIDLTNLSVSAIETVENSN